IDGTDDVDSVVENRSFTQARVFYLLRHGKKYPVELRDFSVGLRQCGQLLAGGDLDGVARYNRERLDDTLAKVLPESQSDDNVSEKSRKKKSLQYRARTSFVFLPGGNDYSLLFHQLFAVGVHLFENSLHLEPLTQRLHLIALFYDIQAFLAAFVE